MLEENGRLDFAKSDPTIKSLIPALVSTLPAA